MYTIQTSPERKLKLCALPTCKGKRYDLVHKFPMNNERAQQWINIIDLPELRKLPMDQIRKRFFICSKHFRPQDYKNCESRSLNTTAYPRLHLKLDENDTVEQCASNDNVQEINIQECDYGVQGTLEITETETHIPIKTEPKSVEIIVCSTTDSTISLRKNRNNQAIILQNPIQIQTTPTTPKPIILKSEILKRNASYTIEPVRKKIILNESDTTKTYSNTAQVNLKGLYKGTISIDFKVLFSLLNFIVDIKSILIHENIFSTAKKK